jgi:predicted transposase/invertase (TIGR01784 family)
MTTRKLISFDWALKKLLRSKANFGILEGFLSELLDDDIHILEILDAESNKDDACDKHNRVDVKVRNGNGEILLIEVQYERELDYLQRILYATSRTLVEHIHEGAPYSEMVKVISINILYFELGHGDDYVYIGQTRFRGLHQSDELSLTPQQRQLFPGKEHGWQLFPEYFLIRVNQFDDVARDRLDEWIYFLKNEEIKDEFSARGLKEAKQKLDVMKLPDAERRAYQRYLDDLHYQASMVESSYGIGKIEGRKEGREEGKDEKARQMARALKDEGVALAIIIKASGLSAREIDEL